MQDHALQQLLDDTARSLGVVGAQVALFDGQSLREFATGTRNLAQKLPVTTDTLFQIGSTTKVFNAALLMSLVDERVVSLDKPICKYLPDFRLADSHAQQSVTLRHLLSMSSGLDNGPYNDYGRGDDALGRYVEALAGIPQIFAPGAGFGYSNASTNVSGYVASRITGQSWEQLLSERILSPLKLKQAAMFAEDLLGHPVALGYGTTATGKTEPVPGWALPRSMAPAGGTLCTSAGDLVRLGQMFLARGRSGAGKRVLSAAAVKTMHTPQITLPTRLMAQKWGVGPYWKKWGGHVIHGHSGTNFGGSSMLLWCPDKNVAIATTVNVANQGYPLANRIFDTVFPKVFKIRKPKGLNPDDAKPAKVKLDRFVGRYESYANVLEVTTKGRRLMAHLDSELGGLRTEMTSELIPLGGGRFLPRDPAMGGNRGWDLAFWGNNARGQATQFLNGMFPFRRTA